VVTFGIETSRVDEGLVELLRTQEASVQTQLERLFKHGKLMRLTEAPFAGIEGLYQMADRERRVMVLIEILSKPVVVHFLPASLRKSS
jgi:transcriptional antiterminator RfaH